MHLINTRKPLDRPKFSGPLMAVLKEDHPKAQDLVGLWLMNEAGGKFIHDLSPYGNHADIEPNDLIWLPEGGVAPNNSEQRRAVCREMHHNDLFADQEITVVASFTWDSASGTQYIFSMDTYDPGFAVSASGPGWPYLYDSVGNYSGGSVVVTSGVPAQVVWTRFGTGANEAHFYIDGGRLEVADTWNQTIGTYTTWQLLGAHDVAGDTYALNPNSECHYIMVWNRGFTAQEALEIYLDPFEMVDMVPLFTGVAGIAAGDVPGAAQAIIIT